MPRPHPLRHCLLPTVLLAVAACAGSGGGDGSSSGKTPTTNSPLAAIFGSGESPGESRRKQLEQENLVAGCMKEKGWNYTPVDHSAQAATDGEEDAELTAEEFGTKYAYGVTRNYELHELPGATGAMDAVADSGPPQELVDPNQDYVAGLSESEQQRYQEDLSGPPFEPPTDDTAAFTPPPLEEQGCYGIASKAVYGESPLQDPEISQRVDELITAMEDDPRIGDANRAWVDCVRQADPRYDLTSPADAFAVLEREKAELAGQQIVPLDPATGAPEGGDPGQMWSSTLRADGTGWAFIGEPAPLDDAALDRLRSDEFALYTIDQACRKQTQLDDIRERVEQDLADRLVEEFPQLGKDGSGGAGG